MSRRINDGETVPPSGCPRGLDCEPIARQASPGFASYTCCGANNGHAPVPDDVFRLCIKSTHDDGPVDVLVNLDHRDVIETAAVLTAALSWDSQVRFTPTEEPEPEGGEG